MRSLHEAGHKVLLLTEKRLEARPWAREAIDEFFFIDTPAGQPTNLEHLCNGLAYRMRSLQIDRVVALDDFDVEKATFLRECFRISGMGQTTGRFFRDKLAMRMRAAAEGLRVPAFSGLFQDDHINQFADSVAFPCVVKPRGEASATGIRKVHSKEELWQVVHELGDRRHEFLVEQFKPGDVYHVDALTRQGKVIFNWCSRYLSTPLEVAHGGGVFRSMTVPFGSREEKELKAFNVRLMKAFNMRDSASHSEFIRCHDDGQLYFLETASRVGGAHLAEMVEAASGINLWREWAGLEVAAALGTAYTLPPVRPRCSGIVISLTNVEHPDMSTYTDPEICWTMHDPYHIGLIVAADDRQRVQHLLDDYARRILGGVHASAPSPAKSLH